MVCPLCIGLAAGGTILSQLLGISDLAVGVWYGLFSFSIAPHLVNIAKNGLELPEETDARTPSLQLTVTLLIISTFAIGFYFSGLLRGIDYALWYMNKLCLGMIVGASGGWVSNTLSDRLKKRNNGVVIPFQTTMMTVGVGLLISLPLEVVL